MWRNACQYGHMVKLPRRISAQIHTMRVSLLIIFSLPGGGSGRVVDWCQSKHDRDAGRRGRVTGRKRRNRGERSVVSVVLHELSRDRRGVLLLLLAMQRPGDNLVRSDHCGEWIVEEVR